MKMADKYDDDKVRMDLIPPEVLTAMAEVLTYGANKYDSHNWQMNGGLEWSRVYSALQRHLNDFWSGEEVDQESGLSHLAHAMCCIAFLNSYHIKDNGFDDRYDV